jgi:branched-chain amino acid transport system substrate-binding protein
MSYISFTLARPRPPLNTSRSNAIFPNGGMNMTKRFRFRAAAVLLAGGALVATACSSSATGTGSTSGASSSSAAGSGSTAGSVTFGSELPLTGSAASVGVPQENGIQLAVNQVNAAGGIKIGSKSYKVNLNVQDDASTGTTGVEVVQKLLQSNISYLFGGTSSEVVGAYLPIIEHSSSVINIISGSVLPGITQYPSVYRFQADVQRNEIAATNFLHSKGYKSVAMLTDRTHAGYVANTGNVIKEMASVGITVTTQQQYSAGDTQYGSQVEAITRTKPDAIVLRGYAADLLRFITQARQLGYTGPIVSTAGYTSAEVQQENATAGMSNVFDVLPPQVANIATSTTAAAPLVAAAKTFVSDYTSAFHAAPQLLSGQGYDSIWIMVAAMEKAGTVTDVAAIRNALNTLTVSEVQHVVLPIGNANDLVFQERQASFNENVIIWNKGVAAVGPTVDSTTVNPATAG